LKNLYFVILAAVVAACCGFANATNSTVVVNTPRTAASNGKQMYTSYCASCHGVDGKGAGPTASALTTKPADLTTLTRNNGGKFPAVHVVSVLQFGAETPAHGSPEMPVWGPLFGKMNQANATERALRVSNLSRYIESIQAR
jgi:mono/diheme cytochrome c family protein